MGERLSNEDLARLDRYVECDLLHSGDMKLMLAELRARRAADLNAADLALIDTALGHLASDAPPYDRAPKAGEVEALRAKLTKGAR